MPRAAPCQSLPVPSNVLQCINSVACPLQTGIPRLSKGLSAGSGAVTFKDRKGILREVKLMSEYIFHSPLAPVVIPEVHITEFVLRKSVERPDQAAIVDGSTGAALSFAELASQIRSTAGGLRARGFVAGDVLALMAPNSPEYVVTFHASALCGGTITTVNPSYGIAEVRQQLVDSRARWFVADQACVAVAKQAMRGTDVANLLCIQDNEHASGISSLRANEIEQISVDLHTHPVVLPYSSGTTGFPKGVMLSHYNMVANLVQMNTAIGYDEHEVGLAVLPFFHIFGMQVPMGSLLSDGHTIITMPRFDMAKALSLIEQYSVTQFYVVPPIVLGFAKSPLVDNYDVSSLKKIFSGAAPLGQELSDEAQKRVGCAVVQGYGMTELSPVSHLTPRYESKPGSSGITLPNTQSRIVDSVGRDLPPNCEGELWVKGPQVMMGYLNNSRATAETLDKDGWLHTGDLAMIDEDGYLTIVDRVKELIKYKGFQVAPAELEALIITHPAVADVAVIGTPDEEAGEVPKAYIVLANESKTQSSAELAQIADDIKSYVLDNLAHYKAIHFIEWINAIPKSASGKILRRNLRDQQVIESA